MSSKMGLTTAKDIFRGKVAYAPYQSAVGAESRRGIITHSVFLQQFGAVVTADADGVCESQSVTASVEALINGALATAGVATFDVPRNVVASWTNTAIVTVTGTDEYGETVVESSASGTSLAGKKAFKTVTSVTFNADVTGATVGSGAVLGLPFRIPTADQFIASTADGGTVTFVAAVDTTPSATTGDVRGTVSFNDAPNGTRRFACLLVVLDTDTKEEVFGKDQYAG